MHAGYSSSFRLWHFCGVEGAASMATEDGSLRYLASGGGTSRMSAKRHRNAERTKVFALFPTPFSHRNKTQQDTHLLFNK